VTTAVLGAVSEHQAVGNDLQDCRWVAAWWGLGPTQQHFHLQCCCLWNFVYIHQVVNAVLL